MKKKIFFVLNKYQSVTYVSKLIFQGLSKNMVFRSAALVIKKIWSILEFFKDRTFSALYPTLYMHFKKVYKKFFKFLFINSQKSEC